MKQGCASWRGADWLRLVAPIARVAGLGAALCSLSCVSGPNDSTLDPVPVPIPSLSEDGSTVAPGAVDTTADSAAESPLGAQGDNVGGDNRNATSNATPEDSLEEAADAGAPPSTADASVAPVDAAVTLLDSETQSVESGEEL